MSAADTADCWVAVVALNDYVKERVAPALVAQVCSKFGGRSFRSWLVMDFVRVAAFVVALVAPVGRCLAHSTRLKFTSQAFRK